MTRETIQQTALSHVNVAGDLQFKGNVTQVGYQNIMLGIPDFDEVPLDDYKPPVFKSPSLTPDLVAHLTGQRLLVLEGSAAIDTEALAKHIAACLIQTLSLSDEKIKAKIWRRTENWIGIDREIQKVENTTIFILPQVSPENIGYDLKRIEKAILRRKEVYVVISTDVKFEIWRQHENIKKYWRNVVFEDVAGNEQLINEHTDEESVSNWYHQKLTQRERLIAIGLRFFDRLSDNQFFAALEEIVEHVWKRRDVSLRALDYCDLEKLHNFFRFNGTRNEGAIIEISSWGWRRNLFKAAWNSDRRQILSVLPVLVDIVRESVKEKYENPELFGNFKKRRELRYAIADALCDLGSISEISVQTALIDLSVNSHFEVRLTAAYAMSRWRHSDYGLDNQLFKTLHKWSDLNKAREIIDRADIVLEQHREENRELIQAESYIKATVLLTIGYAAVYDPPMSVENPGGLANELYDLLVKLAKDTNPVVRTAFLEYALPIVLWSHLEQLSEWIYDLVQQQESSSDPERVIWAFNQGVGKSLAFAYQARTEVTLKLLQDWTEEMISSQPQATDLHKITPRESVLATIAFAYGEIEGFVEHSENNLLTPEGIFDRLHAIFKSTKHPYVRQAILQAIKNQVLSFNYFARIEPRFQDFVAEVKESERESLVELLASIYFHQRINQSGGDYLSNKKTILLGNKSYSYRYQIWTSEQRPQTEIEQTMYNWMKNSRNSIAQQIATRSLVSFANQLDQEEEQDKNRILQQIEAEKVSQANVYQPSLPETSALDFYIAQIVPWLTVFFKWIHYFALKRSFYSNFASEWSYYRQVIKGILPEALKQESLSQSTMDFVLKRLTGLSDIKLKIIADLLKWAMSIAKKPGLVMTGIGLVAIALFALIYLL